MVESIAKVTDPLWCGIEIPVIGLTGAYQSGKTLFCCSIPLNRTHLRFYDFELSAAPYVGTLGLEPGVQYIDVPAEVSSIRPNYKPIDVYQWWFEDVMAIEPGTFSVIAIDTASEVESGLAQWVRENPSECGYSEKQFAKSEALYWGAVKDLWKRILTQVAKRCQTVVFTAHQRKQFDKSGRPTGRTEAKGKSTLMELSSLYLELQRRPDEKGKTPDEPVGVVMKNRLMTMSAGKMQSILPQRLKTATPEGIRQYILKPYNAAAPKKAELLVEDHLSDDERRLIESQTAADRKEAAELELQKQRERIEAAKKQFYKPPSQPAEVKLPESRLTESEQKEVEASLAQDAKDQKQKDPPKNLEAEEHADAIANGAPSRETLLLLRHLKTQLRIPDEAWKKSLAKRNVDSATKLTQYQADEMVFNLKKHAISTGAAITWQSDGVSDIEGLQQLYDKMSTENPPLPF